MVKVLKLTQREVTQAVVRLIEREDIRPGHFIYGVPRGGTPISIAVAARTGAACVDNPDEAHFILDDIYDSGATAKRYAHLAPHAKFAVAFDKREPAWHGQWIVLPWEDNGESDTSGHDAVVRLLQYIGEDPDREGLRQTPDRVLKAWREWCSGYSQDPNDILKTFGDGAENCRELVVMRDIPVYSTCEHHMAPFFGTATIGYIPNGKIIGLSKLVRLTNVFARRLQVQERMTNQIADALYDHLGGDGNEVHIAGGRAFIPHSKPRGVGVIIECRHMCMESRGVHAPNTPTTTSALRGALFDDPRARSEFLALR